MWRSRDYSEIPDSVPDPLMRANLAPSYKAVALAILQNDMGLFSLGFPVPSSRWYVELKREEIEAREGAKQLRLAL